MKLMPSRITISFTLLGLAMALALLGLSAIGAHNSGISDWISNNPELVVFFCPGSIAGLGLAPNPSTQDVIEYCTIVLLSNLVVYFILGLLVSFAVRKVKRWLDPTAILQR